MPSTETARGWSALDHLECPRCGSTHDAFVRQGLCPACGSPLLARYDLHAVMTTPEHPLEEFERRGANWAIHEFRPGATVDEIMHEIASGRG